ncbi:MAG: response regulator [Oscillospiraceae bacterium]|nr:response regulator [Oscillospiraceae bacterium]
MNNRIRRKIIYVDDVNYSLISLKERLKAHYEVYPAQSAHKLFEILERVEPDLILLDINMPDIDGYEVIMKLKADKRFAHIPVIFLTAQNDKDSVFKGLNLGAAAYVNKPFSTALLIEQIENVFKSEKLRNPFKDLLIGEEDFSKPSILAVDDFSVMLRTLHTALRDKYNVYTLTRPEELKSFLQSIVPHLFLLDYNMPVLSGFDLVPIIREFPEHKKTPIIFITSEGTVGNMSAAAYLGACDFIVKPVNITVLREKIDRHIRRS